MESSKVKIGICFGGYNPMHQGHLDCIMKAKKECDYVFIVVCGYDNEPRAITNLDTKFDIINNFVFKFMKDPDMSQTVYCIEINDTLLGIDESESEENWRIWLTEVFRKINELCPMCGIGGWGCSIRATTKNVRFYVGEKHYKEALNKRGIKCDLVGIDKDGNRKNDISATAIRQNPVKYWNKIIPPFRPLLTKKILITGTASEGKSTLVRDLALYFDTTHVDEEGKRILVDQKLKEKDLDRDNYLMFMNDQYYSTVSAMNDPQNKGFIFSDTDYLVTLMYAKSYADIPEFKISADDAKEIEEYYLQSMHKLNTWDKIFLLTPHGEFVDDGIRYMGQSSLEERFKNYYILIELLRKYDLFDKVEFLNGTYYENFITIRDYVNKNIIRK